MTGIAAAQNPAGTPEKEVKQEVKPQSKPKLNAPSTQQPPTQNPPASKTQPLVVAKVAAQDNPTPAANPAAASTQQTPAAKPATQAASQQPIYFYHGDHGWAYYYPSANAIYSYKTNSYHYMPQGFQPPASSDRSNPSAGYNYNSYYQPAPAMNFGGFGGGGGGC